MGVCSPVMISWRKPVGSMANLHFSLAQQGFETSERVVSYARWLACIGCRYDIDGIPMSAAAQRLIL
jgi:hypothetical protein